MNPSQEHALCSGGETTLHSHPHTVTLDQLHRMQQLQTQKIVSENTTLTGNNDIVFVDTSAGNVTVTLPAVSFGQEFTIVKVSALHTLTIAATSPNTVDGASSISYTTQNTVRTYKAGSADWQSVSGIVFDKFPHGAFSSTQTQSQTVINTAKLVSLNTTDYAYKTTRVAGDGIHVQVAGLYNIQFSIQLTNEQTQPHDAAVWLRKGSSSTPAVDVPYTSSVVTISGTHGGQSGYHVVAANFFVYLNVNDYIEFWWAASDLLVKLNALPPITTPFINPGSHSVVVTLSYVSSETA